MTVLGEDDRTRLMNGMFLRRLVEGAPLTEHQLQTAIVQDMSEIRRRFSTFDFDTYVGVGIEDFLTGMVEATVIDRRDDEKAERSEDEKPDQLYERGPGADAFEDELTEKMSWMIDDLPMSTRGVFDSLKSRPSRKVTMTPNEYMSKHSGEGDERKKLIEDDEKSVDPRDHQLKAGRAKKS